MQDRIKQMAEEAYNHADSVQKTAAYLTPEAWTEAMLERFAQAVARECQQIADTTIEQGGECAHNTANAIRARFGIEGE